MLTGQTGIAISRPTVDADNDGRHFGAWPGFPVSGFCLEGKLLRKKDRVGDEQSTSREVWPGSLTTGDGSSSLFLIVGLDEGTCGRRFHAPGLQGSGVVKLSSSICLNAYACGGRLKDWLQTKSVDVVQKMSSLKRGSVGIFLPAEFRK